MKKHSTDLTSQNNKKIEITKDNLDSYMEYVRLTRPDKFTLPLASRREEIAIAILVGASIIIPTFVVPPLVSLYNSYLSVIFLVAIGPIAAFNCFFSHKIVSRMNISTFRKQYPDFDLSISTDEVEKELKKYNELSSIPKNIEENKKEHLSQFSDNFRNATTAEKIDFLNQERQFWEQVAIQEKYSTLRDKNENIGVRKVKQ